MKKVIYLTLFLMGGLILSQYLPHLFSGHGLHLYEEIIRAGTMLTLGFIMIHVGYEFNINKNNLGQYAKDYGVAFTSATFPWIFIAIYFFFAFPMSHDGTTGNGVVNSLLIARFAAPTSAGVLFSMLAAAGLSKTWMFSKTRILAIFDDLDTILLMVPLQMLVVGVKWQMFVSVILMVVLLWLGWKKLHAVKASIRWKNVLFYSAVITFVSLFVHNKSLLINENVPIHIEILLPAFVIGVAISHTFNQVKGKDGKLMDALHLSSESRISFAVSAVFMLFVGLSMPEIDGINIGGHAAHDAVKLDWGLIGLHVLLITLLSNLGKMFPALVYRKEASLRQRLAVSVSMFPRGEVGAGVLIISISHGISGMVVTVAVLSLCLNLMLTVFFIWIVKKLLKGYSCESEDCIDETV